MSFYTSLSGLKGAQTDLSTISNNIANVGTYGFKRSAAQFGDIVAGSSTTPGLGTRLTGIAQDFSQGGFEASEKQTDLAIAGNGFFVTRNALTGGQTAFTRDGSLSVDSNRYLTDSTGQYVQVLPVDAQGNATASGISAMRNLQIPLTSGTPVATSKMDISVGLPSDAEVAANRPMYSASNPWKFDPQDPNSYNESTQTTVYDSAGNSIPATIYFVRTASTASGDPTNSWNAYVYVGDKQASADPTAATPTPLQLQFDDSGKMTSPSSATTFGSVDPTGASAPINLSIDFGSATNQSTGTFTLASLEQDGHGTGKFDDISISDKGLVTATFSDGSTQALGKLAVANFSDPAGLKQLGDAHWAVTGDSGDPVVGTAGQDGFGSIQTGALERANVDITQELVSLISAQRNFQANAKAIDTDNTMTTTIINLRS